MNSLGPIGLIGGGNMAEALIKGLQRGGFPAAELMVSEPREARGEFLTQRYNVNVVTDNSEVVRRCETVLLTFKPQILDEVLGEIQGDFSEEKLLVSILAGVSTANLEKHFSGNIRVMRAMPNTPALVGEGATALCRGKFATREDVQIARKLFESVGIVQIVEESQMDAVTGLSGSGPGYIFTVIEAMADGGVQEGLRKEVALALAVQTVLGAAHLAKETGEHPALLRDMVCSPAGTTIAAMRVLEERGVRSTLMEAVHQAAKRSRELGKGKKQAD